MALTVAWNDSERVAAAASWAAEAHEALADGLASGRITPDTLEVLADGLKVLADTLAVVAHPFPPPRVRPHLRVVE